MKRLSAWCYIWCQEWDGATLEDFSRAWTRFEQVAKAKDWDRSKQLIVLPTLLRGKLLDHFVDLDVETKEDLKKLRTALRKCTGAIEDPLSAEKAFVGREQGPDERVADFASALKKIFRQAYRGASYFGRSSTAIFNWLKAKY